MAGVSWGIAAGRFGFFFGRYGHARDPAAELSRFVQAKPGVLVAALVARGEVGIGAQQLSEPGIDVVGLLPPPVQLVTTFSIDIGARSTHAEEASALIAYLNGRAAAETKRRFGMEPA